MRDQVVRPEPYRPHDLSTESSYGLLANGQVGCREVDQIIVVDHDRRLPVARYRLAEALAVGGRGVERLPSARVGGEYLERVTADLLRAMRRLLNTSGDRRVDAHPHWNYSECLILHLNTVIAEPC